MKRMEHLAMAVRLVGCLEAMETMWAEPVGERWVSLGGSASLSLSLRGLGGVVEKRRSWEMDGVEEGREMALKSEFDRYGDGVGSLRWDGRARGNNG